MKKLSVHLKQALAALAVADAGEMLTRRQMARTLHGTTGNSGPHRRQVALWAGATLSKEALDYALSTCKRLHASLTLLHAQCPDTARLRKHLGNENFQLVALNGRPEAALRQYLSSHSQVAFLVLDGSDPGSHGLAQRAGKLGVPMVLVTGERLGDTTSISLQSAPVAVLG